MSVASFTKSGSKATKSVALPKEIFAVEAKTHDLLHQAYEAYRANGRTNNATTKLRGEVRGGGRKPWKQKGTGRARVGSIRSPLWRGGGITFGPSGNENYSKKISKVAKRTAIKQALTIAAQNDKIIFIEDIASKDGKTKPVADLLAKLGVERRALVAVGSKTPELTRAMKNIANVELVQATYLNVYSVMNADHIILTKEALAALPGWLQGANS